jgi:hypothetical protein
MEDVQWVKIIAKIILNKRVHQTTFGTHMLGGGGGV